MQTLIYLLIGLLLGVILNNYFGTIREGQGPMVGSIMFPTMYQGKTDVTHKPIEVREKQDVKTMVKTQVTEKSDKRVDKDVRAEHWHEQREDVDVKKDVDVVHRYPEIWNVASIRDCNEKKKIIFSTYNSVSNLRESVKNLTEWVNSIMPAVKTNERNMRINANSLKQNSKITSDATMKLANEMGITGHGKPSADSIGAGGKEIPAPHPPGPNKPATISDHGEH